MRPWPSAIDRVAARGRAPRRRKRAPAVPSVRNGKGPSSTFGHHLALLAARSGAYSSVLERDASGHRAVDEDADQAVAGCPGDQPVRLGAGHIERLGNLALRLAARRNKAMRRAPPRSASSSIGGLASASRIACLLQNFLTHAIFFKSSVKSNKFVAATRKCVVMNSGQGLLWENPDEARTSGELRQSIIDKVPLDECRGAQSGDVGQHLGSARRSHADHAQRHALRGLTPEMIAAMPIAATTAPGTGPLKPSTEWRFHLDIMKATARNRCDRAHACDFSHRARRLPARTSRPATI